jgi:preprotein translocase subunit SecD
MMVYIWTRLYFYDILKEADAKFKQMYKETKVQLENVIIEKKEIEAEKDAIISTFPDVTQEIKEKQINIRNDDSVENDPNKGKFGGLNENYGRKITAIVRETSYDKELFVVDLEVTSTNVANPLTGEVEWNDGIGANPIQTNAGAGAMDWNAAKNNGVQLAAPAAEAYAFKDAAEKFGKLFGKDLTRKDAIGYDSLLKTDKPTFESLSDMYAEKVELMSKEDVAFAERVLNKDKPEVNSFKKLNEILIKL